jgi:RNA polymerase sigma-70 factor (ECF subfamily)
MPGTPVDAWSQRSQQLAGHLARIALGDRQAFAALYRETSAHLFGVVLRIQPDTTRAEDILQDIYISLWQSAGSFDAQRSQPLTWLTSIARHRAIDSLRRRRGEVQTVSRHAGSDDEDDETDLLADLPDEAAGPQELLQQATEVRQLARCMQALSSEQQHCLALAYYQGLSHAEVAQHLAQPLGSVKSWVRRALLALKDCLGHAVARER